MKPKLKEKVRGHLEAFELGLDRPGVVPMATARGGVGAGKGGNKSGRGRK